MLITLHKICIQCNGTGVAPNRVNNEPGPGIDPCPWPGCNGNGYVEYGKFDISDFMDIINDIKIQVQALYDDLNP